VEGREELGVGGFVSGAKETLLGRDSDCVGGAVGTVGTMVGCCRSGVDFVNFGKGAGNWKKYSRSSLNIESWKMVVKKWV
jgi:hypothetical protein